MKISRLALAAFTVSLFFLQTANAEFSIGPANPNSEQPSWLLYEAKPGASVTDEVVIRNFSKEAANFNVSVVDGNLVNESGNALTLESTGDSKDQVGKWVTLEKTSLVLEGDASENVKFTLDIPADAEKKKYAGAIIVENVPAPASGTEAPDKPKTISPSVIVSTQVGLRLYLTVTDTPREIPRERAVIAASAPTPPPAQAEESAEAGKTPGTIFTPLNIGLGILFLIILGLIIKSSVSKEPKPPQKSE
ncbi:hypothetical protein HYV58_00565 [Candidatus Peregrinibacteria bacterium]|nr:hypothetical protein [Candidatus Peregrinibacteria bacterium]